MLIESWLLYFESSSLLMCLEDSGGMAQLLGPLIHHVGEQNGILTFSMAQIKLLWPAGA